MLSNRRESNGEVNINYSIGAIFMTYFVMKMLAGIARILNKLRSG